MSNMDGKGKQRLALNMIMQGKRSEVKKEEAPTDHHHHQTIGTTTTSGGGGGGFSSSDEEEQQQHQKAAVVAPSPSSLEMMMKRKKVGMDQSSNSSTNNNSTKCCQVERCSADMGDAKPYHRRHKVCEAHAKAESVLVGGSRQRFCQQCSRFHELSEFDDSKRSCRRRLAGHNERRRKSAYPAESSSGQKTVSSSQIMDEKVCGGKVDAKGKDHIEYPGKGHLQACPN